MAEMIDLHTHSTASDGTLSPEKLVAEAKKAGLFALALTDHDTIAGIKEARKAAEALGLEFVSGVEISVKFEGPGHCHLLGYFVNEDNEKLVKTLKSLHEARSQRNILMVEKLKALGIDITLEELEAISGGGEIGRPHMAKILVKKGVVKNFDEAFDRYLAKGRPAYVPKARLSPEEAITIIQEAGGLVSLAHPLYLGYPQEKIRAYVSSLKDLGLDAIEAYYTDHDEAFTNFCLDLAKEFALLVTGGSDFHGDNKPEIKLGVGKGGLKVPKEVYFELKKAWESR
ncbi:PHP domain-containing protein [Thermodesulfatator atlanticus]|uniref:PHP domain-containing protein n=1 Tax=Thermodesulfatator atlanticus TaxID=501497 RepID=UPI0003B79FAD|nr:PHP domain-containing protein [Thermodesulfatator atlanticus]